MNTQKHDGGEPFAGHLLQRRCLSELLDKGKVPSLQKAATILKHLEEKFFLQNKLKEFKKLALLKDSVRDPEESPKANAASCSN